jgi:hypothetical protein
MTARRFTRDRLAWTCALAAVGCICFSAYLFRPTALAEIPSASTMPDNSIILQRTEVQREVLDSHLGEASVLFALGGALLIAALRLAQLYPALPVPGTWSLTPGRSRWLPVGIGLGVLFVVAEANGQWIGVTSLDGLATPVQMLLLVTGIALVVWGLGGAGSRFHIRTQRSELLLVAGLMTLALVVRVWALSDTIHIFVDEGNFAGAVLGFWEPRDPDLLVPITPVIAFPRLYVYWQSLAIDVLGRNLAGLRLPSAILGALTIPALYLLGRTLFDRTTATIAAALLVALPPHIHFSRLGLNNIADPLFGTLAFAFLGRGLVSNRRSDYAVAGACLGLTQYFYEGGRLLFPLMMLAWMGIGWLFWQERPPLRGLLITGIAAVIVAAPVYYTLLAIDFPIAARMEGTALNRTYWQNVLLATSGDSALGDHLRHIRDTFLIYVHQPEGSYFYAGHHPLLLVYVSPILLLGAVVALRRFRAPGPLLIVVWVSLTSLANSFMKGNTDAPRYVVALPALALMCAFGLQTALRLLWPEPAPRPGWRRAFLAGLVIALMAGQIGYYFDPHIDLFNRQLRAVKPYLDGEDALFRSVNFPPGTQIHLISAVVFDPNYAATMLTFLADDLEVETRSPLEVTTDYLWGLSRSVDHAFFVEPDDTATVAILRLYFDLEPPQYTTYNIARDKQYVLYYAPAAANDTPLRLGLLGEDLPPLLGIAPDLLYQRINAVKTHFRAQAGYHVENQGLAVDIPVEI